MVQGDAFLTMKWGASYQNGHFLHLDQERSTGLSGTIFMTIRTTCLSGAIVILNKRGAPA